LRLPSLALTARRPPPLSDWEAALASLTYSNDLLLPSPGLRALLLTLTDALGAASAPVLLASVEVHRFSRPTSLVLASPAQLTAGGGSGYAAALDETERTTGCALADAGLQLLSATPLLQGATVSLSGARDPNETLTVELAGLSMSASFAADTAAGRAQLTLSGADTAAHYAAALASLRYRNLGGVGPDGALQFTPGVRTVSVLVTDAAGGRAQANASVECTAAPRLGLTNFSLLLGLDANAAPQAACSGRGALSVDAVTGERRCACAGGYEGDVCEFAPCFGRGSYSDADRTCACHRLFSGPYCETTCNGTGTLAADGASCQCAPGSGGADCSLSCPGCLHGLCTAAGCGPCAPGWGGANCSLPCDCYAGGGASANHGACSASLADAASVAAGNLTQLPCICDAGWIASDCSLFCSPSCGAGGGNAGVCSLPVQGPGLPLGLTGMLLNLVNSPANLAKYVSAGLVNASSVLLTSGHAAVTNDTVLSAACTIPCPQPCVYGSCDSSRGACACSPGAAGPTCTSFCSGNGQQTYLTATNASVFDALHGPYLASSSSSPGGLFNVTLLYGLSANSSLAFCACGSTPGQGPPFAYAGPFCATPCPIDCGVNGACMPGANGSLVCACAANWAGAQCTIPCAAPCLNGACSALDGSCACLPGYSGPACATLCSGNGALAPAGGPAAAAGLVCVCDAGWAGPSCAAQCPYAYNSSNGICALRNGSASVGEVVCFPGWSGLPDPQYRVTGRERTCALACSPCDFANAVGFTCTGGGFCKCKPGYIWQGPTEAGSGVVPYPQLADGAAFNQTWHTCAVAHPCSGNGQYLNASCVGTFVPGSAQAWTAASASPLLGWGCAAGGDPGQCPTQSVLYGMGYAYVDAASGAASISASSLGPDFAAHIGTVQGGICLPSQPGALPLANGSCLCDGIAQGRFRFPGYPAGYDHVFQGWAGPSCAIPCAPCSSNGLCNAASGACDCLPGWTGYMCLTPCEPCDALGGACLADGSCLCRGGRRAVDGTYALRLTRDPFYGAAGGLHIYLYGGQLRAEYIAPAYQTAASVEDYLWEVEMECANRAACAGRTNDTQLPVRPNETYFRYGPPLLSDTAATQAATAAATAAGAKTQLAALAAQVAALEQAIVSVPFSINTSVLCAPPGPDAGAPPAAGACLQDMLLHSWGRTLNGCGGDNASSGGYAAVQPWGCDSALKAEFVQRAQVTIGSLKAQAQALGGAVAGSTNVAQGLSRGRWLSNSLGERQRLLDTQLRGVFSAAEGAWRQTRLAGPDYYMTWVIHQLLYGVTFADASPNASTAPGFAGWNCAVPCQPCSPQGGTCQFDGSCECAPGFYGDDCSLPCACTTTGGSPKGVCDRSGACACHTDLWGFTYGGSSCNQTCASCAHGVCDPSNPTVCLCQPGWTGTVCSIPVGPACDPCHPLHGTCLSDGACRCDAGWTGVACEIQCAPCLSGAFYSHPLSRTLTPSLTGTCQPDGSCACDSAAALAAGAAGWALPDCSLLLGPPLARANFSDAQGGWQALNNSCPAALASVRGGAADLAGGPPAAAAAGGPCADGSAPSGAGVGWDAATGYLLLTDGLPVDDVTAGQMAYFRAPPAFQGNLSAALGGALAWSLHLAGGAAQPLTQPHAGAAAAAPDAVLVCGSPGGAPPPPAAAGKQALLGWARANAPLLPLNGRWTAGRVAATIAAYQATPQMALSFSAAGGPPPACAGLVCQLNFGARLTGDGGWVHSPLPGGYASWDWPSPAAAFTRLSEAPQIDPGQTAQPAWLLFPGDAQLGGANGSLAAAAAAAAAAGVVLGFGSPSDALGLASNAGPFATLPSGPGQAAVPSAVSAAAAAAAARAAALGSPASEADLAFCLASVRELLLRADYVSTLAPGGGGESYRLDDVVLSQAAAGALQAAVAAEASSVYQAYAAAYAEEESGSLLYKLIAGL